MDIEKLEKDNQYIQSHVNLNNISKRKPCKHYVYKTFLGAPIINETLGTQFH